MASELAAAGFVPTVSKLHPPPVGIVPRNALVDSVRIRRGEIVVVTAPPGFGKSTFVAELVAGDPRPSAWVSLTPAENDPAALLSYIALAMDGPASLEFGSLLSLWTRPPTIGTPTFARFVASWATRSQPFVLVLDDVHELVLSDVVDVLGMLVKELPDGSTIVLIGRAAVALPLGRLRARRRVVEIGHAELAFDEREASLLFESMGVDVAPNETARLIEQTEGWPFAMYLAALAHNTARRGQGTAAFAGNHRYIVDYLGEELFDELEGDIATFLLEASCLERLSGRLCDDVLQRNGSAELLEDLRRQSLLVIPLDHHREWYRFHHLLRDFLQADLMRRDPRRADAVHLAASQWFDAHGDADGAVIHAVRAGDLGRAESMVMRWYAASATSGRQGSSISQRWANMFPAERLADHPLMMVVAAFACFGAGDPPGALDWLARAESAMPDPHPADVAGIGAPVMLALARAIIAPLPAHEMALEAAYAYDHVARGDGHPFACLARGAAAFLIGDEAAATRWLQEGSSTTLNRPIMVAHSLSLLAVIDIEHDRWSQASTAARRAVELIGDSRALPIAALVLAVHVLVETHAGRGDDVDNDRRLSRQHLSDLTGIAPWINLQARLALARDALIRGHRTEAMTFLDEVEAIVAATPGADHPRDQLALLRSQVANSGRIERSGLASLTTAELRVLRFLPTHLSLADIAKRLYVSRSTVKTQAVSIYRKLGVSTRTEAVAAATAQGLLDDTLN